MNISERAAKMMEDPAAFYGHSLTNMQSCPREEYDQLRLEGLKQRFVQFRNSIPVLKKLTDKQGINEINEFNDVLPLLFDHTMYKSYPPSLLHNSRFDQLTKWLDKLTTVDLSGVDASTCNSIDEWIFKLGAETPINLSHTSGTSGTFSISWKTRSSATAKRRWVKTRSPAQQPLIPIRKPWTS